MDQLRPSWIVSVSGVLAAVSIVGVVVLFASPTSNQRAGSCGSTNTTVQSTAPLTLLSISTPMYLFESSGRFLKGNLASGDWTVISDHGFKVTPTIVPSANGRWISYSGMLKDGSATEYWLYDKQTGRDRLYHKHPLWGGGIPEFSPDGKWLALFVSHDKRWPNLDGAGLYLINIETRASSLLVDPTANAIPGYEPLGFVNWAQDGRELLLTMRASDAGREQTGDHFAYWIADKRFERIDGEYDQQGEKYYRGGLRIAVSERTRIQSGIQYSERASPDGNWSAAVDRAYKLTVSSKEGSKKTIGAGRHDHCSGDTIGINDWLDERHLVYTLEERTYVFDVVTDRRARLFADQEQPFSFGW